MSVDGAGLDGVEVVDLDGEGIEVGLSNDVFLNRLVVLVVLGDVLDEIEGLFGHDHGGGGSHKGECDEVLHI